MNLGKKTILAIAITFFLTMAVGYIYTHTLFLKGYLNLENQEIEANVRRFNYTLDYEIKGLGALTNDWAAWDDSYSFMENYSQEYINSNLVDDTLSELGLNFIIFLDNNGNLIFKKAYDLEKDVKIPLEISIFTYIKKLINTSPLTKEGEYHQGIFSDKGSPVIFAARPILTSLDEGPVRGTLIFGKYLSGDLFDHLLSSVDSEVSVLPYSPDKFNLYPPSPTNPEIRVDISQPETVRFLSLVRDSGDSPIFIFEQFLPRTIYQQGLKSGREFINALMIGSLVAGTIALIALELGFLKRFSKLTRGIKDFEAEKHNGSDMILKGQDEISSLSIEIHKALTQLAETQNDLTTHLDFEKLLVGISTKFINLPIDKIDDGINRLLKVIGEFSKVDRSYILLLREEDPNIMDNTHEWCMAGINSVKESRQNINVNLSSWWIKAMQKGEPIIINDVSLMPEEAKTEREIFIKQPILSLAAMPIIIGREFIGLLGYDSVREKTSWPEQTILLLEVIGTVIANAIDRNRHENRILLNQLNLTHLNEITKNSVGKLTMEAACRTISNRLSILIRCDDSFLVISDENKKLHVYNAGRRLNLDARKQLVLQKLFEKSGLKIIQPKIRRESGNQVLNDGNFLGDSLLALPLVTKGAKLGMIIFSFNVPRTFTSEEILFCQQSASQITLSILKTKALESAHQRSDELSALRATIADITSELKLSKLLLTLLERAIRLMKADGGDFCMVDEENGDLKVVASVNLDKNYVGSRIRYGEGASGKALATKQAVLIEDYSSWPERLEILKESNLRSAIVLPLMIGDRILGTLGIFHFDPEKQFSSDDQHLLSLFAQHASIAMENALLFEKVQQMARIDEVTGMLNRRAFKEIGEYEVNRAKRLGHSLSLAMIDIDNFKHINDTFGHNVGDQVLKETARILRENIRNIDMIGRYGGDEATILMPETNNENAIITMERLRGFLEKSPIKIGNEIFHITASIGVVSHLQDPPELDKIIKQADSAMYSAKKDGKNCLRIYDNKI